MNSLLSSIAKRINSKIGSRLILSVVVYLNLFVATLLYAIVALLPLTIGIFLLKIMRRSHAAFIRQIINWYGIWITRVGIFPFIRFRYCDTAPQESGPGIYICNHRSASDPFFAWIFNRRIIQVVNGWPMRLFFFGFFARNAGYVDVTTIGYEAAKTKFAQLIADGVSIVAFPEGTRSGCREMNKFHSLVFRIAHDLKLRIYPCGIIGNENIPDRRFLLSCGTVQIFKFTKIEAADYAEKNPYCLKEAVWHLLERAIREYEYK